MTVPRATLPPRIVATAVARWRQRMPFRRRCLEPAGLAPIDPRVRCREVPGYGESSDRSPRTPPCGRIGCTCNSACVPLPGGLLPANGRDLLAVSEGSIGGIYGTRSTHVVPVSLQGLGKRWSLRRLLGDAITLRPSPFWGLRPRSFLSVTSGDRDLHCDRGDLGRIPGFHELQALRRSSFRADPLPPFFRPSDVPLLMEYGGMDFARREFVRNRNIPWFKASTNSNTVIFSCCWRRSTHASTRRTPT